MADFLAARDTQPVVRLGRLLQRERLLLGDIVLCVILRGARSEAEAIKMRERLADYMVVEMAGGRVAARAAMHYRPLRGEGITVRSMADTLCAPFCIMNRHRLLHNDRDFRPMVEHLGLLEA